MPDYQLSKIYKIEPINSLDDGDVYYGSSIQKYLSTRMTQHVSKYKKRLYNMSSYILFDKYGVSNCNIILVENYPCNSKNELFAREKYYIKNHKCVNKLVPLHDGKEYRETNKERLTLKKKEYYINNLEQIKHHQKVFYENNKQKILQSNKEYRLKNKEKSAIQSKIYRETNKQTLLQKYKDYYQNNKYKTTEKVECECGIFCRKDGLLRHRKTENHIKIMKSKTT